MFKSKKQQVTEPLFAQDFLEGGTPQKEPEIKPVESEQPESKVVVPKLDLDSRTKVLDVIPETKDGQTNSNRGDWGEIGDDGWEDQVAFNYQESFMDSASINFDAQIEQLKAKTEYTKPFTMTKVEDILFIDKQSFLTLEYHHYQNGCEYKKLRKIDEYQDENGVFKDLDDKPIFHKLGTQHFQRRDVEGHPMSQFSREDFANYEESIFDILRQQRCNKNSEFSKFEHPHLLTQVGPDTHRFQDIIDDIETKWLKMSEEEKQKHTMDIKNPLYAENRPKKVMKSRDKLIKEIKEQEFSMVEGSLVLYNVNDKGGLTRVAETDLKMGRKFKESQNGNMMLTRSKNKKIFSVANFDYLDDKQEFFKILAWTTKLKKFDVPSGLAKGMNEYFKQNKEFFAELIEISFCGDNKFVELVYVEKKKWYDEKIQQLTEEMDKRQQKNSTFNQSQRDRVIKENLRCRAKKYVYFEAQTGKVVFEIGGADGYEPWWDLQDNQERITAHLLSVQVKQIKEENFKPYLVFYYAGDFLSEEKQEEQYIFKYGLIQTEIDMNKMFSQFKDQESRMQFLRKKMLDQILQARKNKGDFYLFDASALVHQRFQWQSNIQVAATRKFDQFIIVNTPDASNKMCDGFVYVNGPAFLKKIQKDGSRQSGVPYYKPISKDYKWMVTRNQVVKDELYLQQVLHTGDAKVQCFRLDHKDEKQRVITINMPITDWVGSNDVFLRKTRINSVWTDIFHTLNISKHDQCAVIQSRIPDPSVYNSDPGGSQLMHNVERRSSWFKHFSADLPVMVHNKGDSKLLIEILLNPNSKKILVLDLEQDERFIGFVEFKSYEDIGFYPKHLNIECCSKFLYMTAGKNNGTGQSKQAQVTKNRLNLLLVDPYQSKNQVALFRSISCYDNAIQNDGDVIIRSIVQSNMIRKRDLNFKIYIWSQMPDQIIRSKLLKIDKETGDVEQDSDEETEQVNQDEDYLTKIFVGKPIIDSVVISQDERDNIYYIQRQNGLLSIMEGSPRDCYQQNHACIFELKANKCLGFEILNANTFFFMDDNHIVYKLVRSKSSRELFIEAEMHMREIQRLELRPRPFEDIILRERYVLFRSKIYFFYNAKVGPWPEGMLEPEQLMDKMDEQKLQPIKGPIPIRGSNQFLNIYRHSRNTHAIYKVQVLPDQTQKTLINDFQNLADFSTFLNNGDIMVKIKSRFMIFNSDGLFINTVDFNETGLQRDRLKTQGMTYPRFLKEVAQKKPDLDPTSKRQAIDYNGEPYDFFQRDKNPLGISEKMYLIQVSQSCEYYLFYKKTIQKLIVYKLQKRSFNAASPRSASKPRKSSLSVGMNSATRSPDTYMEFKFQYELDFDSSSLFLGLYDRKEDPIDYILHNANQVVVQDDSIVTIIYQLPIANDDPNIDPKRQKEKSNKNFNWYIIKGVKFEKDSESPVDKGGSKCINFQTTCRFPKKTIELMDKLELEKIKIIDDKIDNMYLKFSRMPQKYHDYFQYETYLEEKERMVEIMSMNQLNIRVFYNNMVIIYFGNLLRYTYMQESSKNGAKQIEFIIGKDNKVFQEVNFQLGDSDEILKIMQTEKQEEQWLQIIVLDHVKNIFKIITWDFKRNVEKSMMQLQPNRFNDIGNHIVKGMNHKLNYLLDQYRIFDLEFNIPILQKNVNQGINVLNRNFRKQLEKIEVLSNQKKIFWDNTKFLGVEKPHCLYRSVSKLEILIWQGIDNLRNRPEDIKKINLSDMNIKFNSCSLFHFYSWSSDIISVISKKYFDEKNNGTLTQETEYFPLQILGPDNDNLGALFLTIRNNSPKSFELMVQMLYDFPNICLSRMMLKSMPMLISHQSECVVDFLEKKIYKPPQMAIEQFIPWEPEMEEMVFASHTSLIWEDLLLDQLEETGVEIIGRKQIKQEEATNDGPNSELTLKDKIARLRSQKSTFRSIVLDPESANEQNHVQPMQRVSIEAVELDWIFENGSARTLIELLGTDANDLALTKKSIHTFVDLVWGHYQQAIIKFVLIPYIAHAVSSSLLASSLVGEYIKMFDVDTEHEDTKFVKESLRYSAALLQTISTIAFLYFTGLECMGGMISDFLSYLADPWNVVDFLIILLTTLFQLMFSICCYYEREIISVKFLRTVGSFLIFFMWIKVFYWMRLFPAYAYYVKLIMQTIIDAKEFSVMVFIIIISFSTFFYIINTTQVEAEDDEYIPEITGAGKFLDGLISIYLLGAMGDFDSGMYQVGYNKYMAIGMFLLATFIIQAVFMNMLIAIMGETFGNVLEASEQNGLREQVNIMADFAWIVNLDKLFKDKKYIIKVKPVSDDNEHGQDPVLDQVAECEKKISSKISELKQTFEKAFKGIDLQTKYLNGNQNMVLRGIVAQLKHIEKNQTDQMKNDDLNLELHVNQDQLMVKKMEILDYLSPSSDQMVDQQEQIKTICVNWMKLMDKDHSGSVNEQEFYDSFKKMSGVTEPSKAEMEALFKEFDIDQGGTLEITELAQAIKDLIQQRDAYLYDVHGVEEYGDEEQDEGSESK